MMGILVSIQRGDGGVDEGMLFQVLGILWKRQRESSDRKLPEERVIVIETLKKTDLELFKIATETQPWAVFKYGNRFYSKNGSTELVFFEEDELEGKALSTVLICVEKQTSINIYWVLDNLKK